MLIGHVPVLSSLKDVFKASESFSLLIHGWSMKDKGLFIISAALKQDAYYTSHSWQKKNTWAELS